jgi:hypothetical protein
MQFFGSRQTLALISVLFVALLSIACIRTSPSYESDKMVPVGPEVKASLVIYFKVGTTDDQIEDFWHGVLSDPDPQGKGYYHRPGVGDLMRVFPAVQGHEGIAVTFFPEATRDQREELEAEIKSSPIVYIVLKNVAPNDVKKLD